MSLSRLDPKDTEFQLENNSQKGIISSYTFNILNEFLLTVGIESNSYIDP